MSDDYIEQSTARRLVVTLGALAVLMALAGVFMSLGHAVGYFAVLGVSMVPGLYLAVTLLRNARTLLPSHGYQTVGMRDSYRGVVRFFRATGWNPKLVGILLAIPLAVAVGVLIWLMIVGAPELTIQLD